ncbi:phage tail collar domain-containing protein [Canicola haemoglobinophilus]|uniref:Phage tail collar domain-containing protein n=1 Tax=Canicola haemoglobinophilus TaxID=733 RepID=A0AB38HFA4_9PAST|nr:tail fiber protein [Canicola haemoglobinophilus]STO54381.1 phage tail collar domain-containing protein [Canicola haemoglobinophilus]STO68915.1 phage tail collar domain-containing protein [Canicola haemoglobinophilus]
MTVYNKLDEKVFASQAKPRETENFPNIARGWGISFEQTAGIPPMEWFNGLFKRIDEHMLYLAQRGLAEWSSTLEYPQGAYVQYNGKTYRSLQQNTNHQPDTPDSAYWVRWGFALDEIPYATLSQKGLAQLYTGYDSQREDLALTPKTAYLLKALIDSNSRSLNDRIPNSKKSDATDSNSSDTVATSKAVKEVKDIAESKQSPADTLAGYGITNFKIEQGTGNANDYKTDGNYYFASGQNLPDSNAWHIEVVSGGQANAVRQIARKANDTKIKTRFFNGSSWTSWKDTGGDGIPIGAIVAFPKEVTNPQGFLLVEDLTFNPQTYPDLYRTLGNKNKVSNIKRSDVGMLAYFPTDNIPDGWIDFDSIRTTVTQQNYPELYQHLVDKYGSINNVPLAEDRFIRNAHGSLAVGQKQTGSLIAADSTDGGAPFSPYVKTIGASYAETANKVGLDIINANEMSSYDAGLGWAQGEWVPKNKNEDLSPAAQNPNSTGHLVGVARPKSIAFKLCIKAKNTFDDVKFWIKAFGEVANVGELDASRLAQELQGKADANHTHTTSQITNFNQTTNQLINAAFSYQKIANFEIYKFPDGTMIQTYRSNQVANHNNNVLGFTFNWAQTFVSTPVLSGTVHSELDEVRDCWITFNKSGTTNAKVKYWLFEGSYNTNNLQVNIIGIGRWK